MRTVLAGDLGGTKCRFALVGDDFGVHCVQRVETVRDRATFLQQMADAVQAVLAAGREQGLPAPVAAGLGAAAIISRDGKHLGDPPNLPLEGFGLVDWLQQRIDVPVTLLNDGRASAWGEFLRGHAAGEDPLLCLFFGTGIGIGLIADGKAYLGGANAAGEIGHTVYEPGGRTCPCGRKGHYEAYCGGRAITERAAQEVGGRDAWSVGDVVEVAAGSGTSAAAAKRILDDARAAACTMVANSLVLLNPDAVVLGGGVLAGWPDLREAIIEHVRENLDDVFHRDLQFVDSLGGSDAILWGASAATGALWPR